MRKGGARGKGLQCSTNSHSRTGEEREMVGVLGAGWEAEEGEKEGGGSAWGLGGELSPPCNPASQNFDLRKGGNGDGCGMGDALAVGSIWLAPASPGVADGADACPWSRSGLSSAAMSRMIANGLLMSTARGRKPVLPLILVHRQISHSGRLNASRLLHSPKVEI